jgi:hypothetical protein
MRCLNRLPHEDRNRSGDGEAAWERAGLAQGVIQRVDYERRAVRVIADGRAWLFVLSGECQMWFEGAQGYAVIDLGQGGAGGYEARPP